MEVRAEAVPESGPQARERTQTRSDQGRYEELMDAMRNAESRLEPVLQPLRDNVLFLKHNLNARPSRPLDAELAGFQSCVDSLVGRSGTLDFRSRCFIGEINSNWPS
jgi:hypothetical protein